MEFTISAFAKRLKQLMYDRFPYEPNQINQYKHKNRSGHIRDVALGNNDITFGEDIAIFEIGNAFAEERYPYYHILQDAPYIRKRGRGTSKTKGSQARVEYNAKRDYNVVRWNGKTYSKEYSKNVRGKRNRIGKVSQWATDYNGERIFINREANSYLNIHYQYIDKMLSSSPYGITDTLAEEFGLRKMRTVNSGLGEDYQAQEHDTYEQIIESLQSFM